MRWMPGQQSAIDARNDSVLVSAAAGSGKTAVLVERVLSLLREGGEIDRMLIVTFTRAAAGEMRERIGRRLEEEGAFDAHLRRQAMRIGRAAISTLHVFCLRLLRQHFEAAGIDPMSRVSEEDRLNALRAKARDTVLEAAYADPTEDEQALLSEVALLTAKPVIYAANLSDEDFSNGIEQNEGFKKVKEIAAAEHAGVLPICAQIEEEIVEMDKEEKELFLADMGLEESGLDRLIKECYALLGLISFLTAGKQEVRAWTIKNGTKAPQAAGKIHSDFERGFIRAEVIAYDDLIACGSMAAAKEKGLVRSEGKEYVMKDVDVVLFRFNV